MVVPWDSACPSHDLLVTSSDHWWAGTTGHWWQPASRALSWHSPAVGRALSGYLGTWITLEALPPRPCLSRPWRPPLGTHPMQIHAVNIWNSALSSLLVLKWSEVADLRQVETKLLSNPRHLHTHIVSYYICIIFCTFLYIEWLWMKAAAHDNSFIFWMMCLQHCLPFWQSCESAALNSRRRHLDSGRLTETITSAHGTPWELFHTFSTSRKVCSLSMCVAVWRCSDSFFDQGWRW